MQLYTLNNFIFNSYNKRKHFFYLNTLQYMLLRNVLIPCTTSLKQQKFTGLLLKLFEIIICCVDDLEKVLSSCIVLGCNNGTYGSECNNTCGHCVNDDVCIHTNGTCLNGCDSGYVGDLCKTSK